MPIAPPSLFLLLKVIWYEALLTLHSRKLVFWEYCLRDPWDYTITRNLFKNIFD